MARDVVPKANHRLLTGMRGAVFALAQAIPSNLPIYFTLFGPLFYTIC
jgi:hypothetical protein